MDASKLNTSDTWQRLVQGMRRDKKRAAILGILALVVVVLVARVVVKRAPRRAGAAAVAPAKTGGDSSVGGADQWIETGRRNARARREEYLAKLDRDISRDLFNPDLSLFPAASEGAGRVKVTKMPTGPGWFAQVNELVAERDRTLDSRRTLESNVRLEAQGLSLTSTMMGRMPLVVINGQVLRVGSTISGFQLLGVFNDKCVLTKNGVQVELYMNSLQPADRARTGRGAEGGAL